MTVRIQDTIKMKHYLLNRSSLIKVNTKKADSHLRICFREKIQVEFRGYYFIASLTALPIFPLGS